MSSQPNQLPPGAYRFLVKSAAEAVDLIRERLGPDARVLSVRAVEATGLRRLFRMPQLEVIAQIDVKFPDTAASSVVSNEPALLPEASHAIEANPRVSGLPPAGLANLLRRSGLTET